MPITRSTRSQRNEIIELMIMAMDAMRNEALQAKREKISIERFSAYMLIKNRTDQPPAFVDLDQTRTCWFNKFHD